MRAKPARSDREHRRCGDQNDEHSEVDGKVAGFVHVDAKRAAREYQTADLNSRARLLHEKNATFKRSFLKRPEEQASLSDSSGSSIADLAPQNVGFARDHGEADGIEVPTDKALDKFSCTIFGIALQKINS